MACLALDGDFVRDEIEAALNAAGLRLVEIANQERLRSPEYLDKLDAQLARNVSEMEPGKVVVWGTIHTYLAEGEA